MSQIQRTSNGTPIFYAQEHELSQHELSLSRAYSAASGEPYRARIRMGVMHFSVMMSFGFLWLGSLSAQELNLNPTRPTVANSATIQDQGVLQIETGYDAYPQHVPGNQQTIGVLLSYVPLKRLRLDYAWSPFSHQETYEGKTSGTGTIQVGGKVVLFKEEYSHAAPGIAIQYESELPTASEHELQNFGQQVTVLVNHHYGKGGILDVIVNGSLVQSACQTGNGCSYGGQQSFALSYHLGEHTRLYAEMFGQNNSQSNTPPGTYAFGGFYHQFRGSLGLDGGIRFGLTNHSASVGTTVGVVFGKRMHGASP